VIQQDSHRPVVGQLTVACRHYSLTRREGREQPFKRIDAAHIFCNARALDAIAVVIKGVLDAAWRSAECLAAGPSRT
jgi:hypothetical protein